MQQKIRSTTVLCVRRDGKVVMAGDGQVTLGNEVLKSSAKKLRRLYNDKILSGFAGSTADAFSLFARFETKLEQFNGNLPRSVVYLARNGAQTRSSGTSRPYCLWPTPKTSSSSVETATSWSPTKPWPPSVPVGRLPCLPPRHCCAIRSCPPATSSNRPCRSPPKSASLPTNTFPTMSLDSHGDLPSQPVRGRRAYSRRVDSARDRP